MKAVIYAVRHEDRFQWRISLDADLHADYVHWLRLEPSLQLWRSVDLLPFGKALEEVNRLQLSSSEPEQCRFPLRMVSMEQWAERLEGAHMEEWLPDKLADAMNGRLLLTHEFVSLLDNIEEASADWQRMAQSAYLAGWIDYHAGILFKELRVWWSMRARHIPVCRRCGSGNEAIRWTDCAACGESCPYCEACLSMGRARHCTPLLLGRGKVKPRRILLDGQEADEWLRDTIPFVPLGNLRLSPAQAAAADAGVRFLTAGDDANGQPQQSSQPPRRFLIWAVTGAGKTEMMYPLVAAERSRGGKVLIATPRKDVVLELLPRVQATFAGHSVAALYGGSVHRWESAHITIATTHQLFRYEAAFDLVVLDEVDAYPYHNNPMLEYAARKSCKPGGAFVLLSATPPKELQREARRGRLPHVKVPVRHHRHPLPVPVMAKPQRLAALLRDSLSRGAQAFVFVPQIAMLDAELRRVRQALSEQADPLRIEATSSQDPDRQAKVLRFRSGETVILLTTTILERGITIPKADVLVLNADARLFDSAALVQMAGRAGRSAKDPDGRVYYLSRQRTLAQVEAIRHIRAMNRLARKQGYLERRERGE